MYLVFHIICIIYCMYHLIKSYNRTQNDGSIGQTPGLDIIMIIAVAPILAVSDVVLTFVRLYKERMGKKSQ